MCIARDATPDASRSSPSAALRYSSRPPLQSIMAPQGSMLTASTQGSLANPEATGQGLL
jgi:hypothetical protein